MPSMEVTSALNRVANQLGMDPAWLMAIVDFETGGTFSTSVKNPVSGATGLIQFMPSTAARLGTTTDQLARMSPDEQAQYVYRYFQPYAGRIASLEDAYMAVLWPAAIGKPDDYVLFSRPSVAYQQNSGLDRSGSGRVTKRDAAAPVVARYRPYDWNPLPTPVEQTSELPSYYEDGVPVFSTTVTADPLPTEEPNYLLLLLIVALGVGAGYLASK